MDGIYTNGLRSSLTNGIREREEAESVPEFQSGDIIEGIVTTVSEQISINFSGKEFHFPKEAVQNAKEGEKRTYKIMEASGASFVLKEIGKVKTESGQGKILFTTVDTGMQMIAQNFGTLPGQETGDDRFGEISDRATEEDCKKLEEEGMTLEKYNLERLERLLERMKAQAALKQAGMEGQLMDKQLSREAVANTAKKNAIRKMSREGLSKQIAERLVAANLPVTQNNVSRIADAMIMAEEAQHMTEASFSYLIGNELQPTIENCYKAVHAGAKRKQTVSDNLMKQLEPQITEVLQKAEQSVYAERRITVGEAVEVPDQTDARWLLEQELPLTAENLIYKKELEQLVSDFGTERLSREAVLDGTIENLYQRTEPKQTNLNLLRKKEEARLHMTEESLDTMRKLGVEADVEAIRERIESLKQQEQDYFRQMLMADGKEITMEAELFTQTLEAAEKVRNSDVSLLAKSFETRNIQTLRSLSEIASENAIQKSGAEGSGTQAGMQAAAEAYEPLMTAPRRDMGDSIQKAFRNVDSQLESLGMELSAANQRAVRILGYNNIPLTRDNINEMKFYDAQVRGLVEQLQPQVTVELIRRGINPLEGSLTQVSSAAEEIRRELGVRAEERFSEYLVKLDRKHELTAEERESYIGIYRMLYQIEKTDGAAVGALIKSGKELTLANLLTESRVMKRRGMDISVDDAFGEAETTREGSYIDDQIAAAYHNRQLHDVTNRLTPDRLQRLMEQGTDVAALTPEQLAELMTNLPEGETDRAYRSEQLDKLRTLAENSDIERRFLDRFGMEDSPEQIQAAKTLLLNENTYRKLQRIANDAGVAEDGKNRLAVNSEEAAQAMTSRETISWLSENLQGTASELMEALYAAADLNAEQAGDLRELLVVQNLKKQLLRKEFFDIPVADENGITGIRLTVIQGSNEEGKFRILLKQEAEPADILDETTVRVDGSYRQGRLEILMASYERSINDRLKEEIPALKNRLKEAGIDCGEIFCTIAKSGAEEMLPPATESEPEQGEKINTSALYTAAKEIVLHLRRIYNERNGLITG